MIYYGSPWVTYLLGAFAVAFLFLWLCLALVLCWQKCSDTSQLVNFCKSTTIVLLLSVLTLLSYMSNNSAGEFPLPVKQGEQPCGLEIPHGLKGNESAQFHFNGTWIWVDLKDPEPVQVTAGRWKYSKKCKLIFKYDIVKDRWAMPCARWCSQQWGKFSFNEACAFGLVPNENPKGMPVLRACQKAIVANTLNLTDANCWSLGFCITGVGLLVGFFRYWRGESAQVVPKFETRNKSDGKVKLLPLPGCSIEGVTRGTASFWGIVRMGLSLFIDVFTDFTGGLLFLAHGQPFFAAYQTIQLALVSAGDDLLGTGCILWWCWSVEHSVPHIQLVSRKGKEFTEGTAGLVIFSVFFLTIPSVDEDGEPVLGVLAVLNFGVSLFSSYVGIFDGAEASRINQISQMHPEWFLDYDARLEHLERNTLLSAYAFAIASQRIAFAGTLGVLTKVSASLRPALTYTVSGVLMGLTAALLLGVYIKISGKQVNCLYVSLGSAIGISVSLAALSAIPVWYGLYATQQLAQLPWHVEPAAKGTSSIQLLVLWTTIVSVAVSPLTAVIVAYDLFVHNVRDNRYNAVPQT